MTEARADAPSRVTLREIDGRNLPEVLALRVTDEPKKVYPCSNAVSIAQGHHPPDDDPTWMRAIYAGDDPVGFLMTSERPDLGVYYLWRLMVDAAAQGRGYGERAVKLLVERIRATGNAKVLLTSHLDDDDAASGFYRRLGFEYTGEVLAERDLEMKLEL
jgi:diamine N-acetyltransferase